MGKIDHDRTIHKLLTLSSLNFARVVVVILSRLCELPVDEMVKVGSKVEPGGSNLSHFLVALRLQFQEAMRHSNE